jgi:hypothetical protein
MAPQLEAGGLLRVQRRARLNPLIPLTGREGSGLPARHGVDEGRIEARARIAMYPKE